MNKNNSLNKEAAVNQLYSLNSMPQNMIYDISDSEDETEQVKGDDASVIAVLDPELLSHLNHLPSIKVEEHEIQEIVDRYICIERNSRIKSEIQDCEKRCSDETKISYDIYADPIPSCSHQTVEILKVPNVPSNQAPSNFCRNVSQDTNTNPSSYRLHEKVSNDMYHNPTPGCSHHYDDAQNEGPVIIKTETISPSSWNEDSNEILAERSIKCEPDLDIEICSCSSIVCDAVGKQSGTLDHEQMAPRKSWNSDLMVKAIIAVRNKEMGYKAAAKAFSVPRATLKDYVKSNLSPEECINTKFGRKPVFSADLERSLVEYCLDMEHNYNGLTVFELRQMAYQFAIKKQVGNPFSNEAKAAGKKWVNLFFKRHPEISLRRPQNLSMTRTKEFTTQNTDKYSSLLKEELEKLNSDPSCIFNVDETA